MLMCGRRFELYADTYHERIEWEMGAGGGPRMPVIQ